MPYEYDVFISYTHDNVNTYFVPEVAKYLETFVGNELGRRPVKIFIDRPGIEAGASWPETLYRALGTSATLVAIWNPTYFASEWCRRECAAMLKREGESGLERSVAQPSGLIVPMRVFDGQHFPKAMQTIQGLDFHPYWVTGFEGTPRYVEFQDQLKTLATSVADAIDRAPPWDASWLTMAWLRRLPLAKVRPPKRRTGFAGLE